MTLVVMWAVAAAAFSGFQWAVAKAVATQRAIALGGCPIWLVFFSAILTASIVTKEPNLAGGTIAMFLAGVFMTAYVDAKSGYLFDILSVPLALGAIASVASSGSLLAGILSGSTTGGILLALHVGTHGRGIGLGDVKLGAIFGLALGGPTALIGIALAFVFGAAYGIALIIQGRAKRSDAVVFGPFLAAGALAAVGIHIWKATI